MTPIKVDDEHLLDRLTEVFCVHGYEGASLSRITEATGLQRSSLYHRFPGGKTDMVKAVLDRAGSWLEAHLLGPLSGGGSPRERVETMTLRLAEFYGDGGKSCLLDTLSLGDEGSELKSHVDQALRGWVTALSKVARDAGFDRAEARRRAEDAVVLIQGSLVFSRATGDKKPFARVLRGLPELLSPESPG